MTKFLYNHATGIMFRRLEASDLPDLTALKNESWFGTHRVSFVSDISQQKWLSGLDDEDIHAPRNLVLVAGIQDTEVNVGIFKVTGIDWQSGSAHVGWDIYKMHRGDGWGKKIVKAGVDFCFDVLNLYRLQAEILQENQRSLACAEAAGFRKEGVQRCAVLRNRKRFDSLVYGILNDEANR